MTLSSPTSLSLPMRLDRRSSGPGSGVSHPPVGSLLCLHPGSIAWLCCTLLSCNLSVSCPRVAAPPNVLICSFPRALSTPHFGCSLHPLGLFDWFSLAPVDLFPFQHPRSDCIIHIQPPKQINSLQSLCFEIRLKPHLYILGNRKQ